MKVGAKRLNWDDVTGHGELYDRLFDLVAVAEKDGRLIYANRVFLNFACLQKSDAEGWPIPPRDRQGHQSPGWRERRLRGLSYRFRLPGKGLMPRKRVAAESRF